MDTRVARDISRDNDERPSESTYASLRPIGEGEQLAPGEVTAEQNGQEEHADEIELPEDAYGAAIFALIYDARELLSGRDHDQKPFWLNMYRLAYVLAVLIVNYVFQFLMLWWIADFVVQPSVHSVQHVYAEFHGRFFTADGEFMRDTWDGATSDWDVHYKKQLCHMVFSKFYFLWLVLMLWVMIMVIEFRNNTKLLVDVFKVPACPNSHPELMIRTTGGGFEETEADDDKLLVVGLTPFVRILVFLIILIPKFIIGACLMMLGMCWLSATESFSELILNSLALEFVIGIDDHLFEALLPEAYREDMKKVVLHIPRKTLTMQEQIHEDWVQWKTSTFYFLFFSVFSYCYLTHLQFLPVLGILPYFRHDIAEACEPFLEERKTRLCYGGFQSQECFLYGND